MPNRYYLMPARTAGVLDFLTSFAATRKAKDEAEKGLQAQASAQESQAWAGAVGNVGGGILGGLVGRNAPGDMTDVQRFQLASSFVPSMGRTTQVLGQISGDEQQTTRQQAAFQQQRAMETLRTDENLRQIGAEIHAQKFGELPPATAAAFRARFGPAAMGGGPPVPMTEPQQNGGQMGPPAPDAVPAPVINPAITPQFREAQNLVSSYESMMSRGNIPPMERAAIEAQYGPRVAQARQIIQRMSPPKTPTTYQEALASGEVFPVPRTHNLMIRQPDGSLKLSTATHPTGTMGPEEWGQLPPQQREAAKARHFQDHHYSDPETGEEYLYDPKQGRWEKQKDDAAGKTLFDKTMEFGSKPNNDGEIPFANDTTRQGAMRYLAAIGEYPPTLTSRIESLKEKLTDGSLSLIEVQGLQIQLKDIYGEMPSSLALTMAEFAKAVAPQAPPALPSEKSMSRSERMRRERLGIPTAESVTREQKQIKAEQEQASEDFEAGRVQWEQYASVNMSQRADVLKVIDSRGVVSTINREQDLPTQIQTLKAAGYRIPGLDGETEGIAPPVGWLEQFGRRQMQGPIRGPK